LGETPQGRKRTRHGAHKETEKEAEMEEGDSLNLQFLREEVESHQREE